jgi:hypothetical protein
MCSPGQSEAPPWAGDPLTTSRPCKGGTTPVPVLDRPKAHGAGVSVSAAVCNQQATPPAPQKTSASVSACKRFGISHPDLISTVALARWRSNVVRTEPFQRLFQHAPSRIPAPGVAPQPRRGRGGVPSVSSLPFPSRLRPFAPPASHNCPKFLNAKLHRCRQINELPAARSR